MKIDERTAALQQRIKAAAERAGRNQEDITLVAVTKTWPAEVVAAAYRAGLRHFGENRVEELAAKRPEVDRLLGGAEEIVWHAIGPLQSRKTTLAADNADVFHALDRFKIARRISNRLVERGMSESRPLPVFIEVNVSGESSKAGVAAYNWEEDSQQRDRLLKLAASVVELPGLLPKGLMTMAPWEVPEEVIRKVFARTRELASWVQSQRPDENWSNLSMGMTDDFEIAIEEGATHVRIGRAIFGSRR